MKTGRKSAYCSTANNGLRRSGAGTPDGTYEERMKRPESLTLEALGAFAETVSAGIVYDRAGLDAAMSLFLAEKVDGVYVQYLSWAPDALWMRSSATCRSCP